MSMTDPIADMLTRIRNASTQKHEEVTVPGSKVKERIAQVLKESGYIAGFKVSQADRGTEIKIGLKYVEGTDPAITGIRRVSKPGRRVYVGKGEIPQVLNGLGVAMVSTNRGIITDADCRRWNVGGEVLCYVW